MKFRVRRNPKTGMFQIITINGSTLSEERPTIADALNRLFYLWVANVRDHGIETWHG